MSQVRLGFFAIPILAIMTGNAAISMDMYLPAFPAIAADFGVDETEVQRSLSTFLFGFACGQLFYGPLSDSLGRRPVILVFLVLYGVISAFCALSETVDHFVLMRFFQGLAGASGAVLGRAVIRDAFHGPELNRAMSLLMMILTGGPMLAPLIGSFVLDWAGWREIFWTLVAYACLWSVLIFVFIPESLSTQNRVPFRFVPMVVSLLHVFKSKIAMGYALCVSLGFACMFVYITVTPFLYIDMFGITPREYALFFGSNVFGMAVCSYINRHFASTYSTSTLSRLWSWMTLGSAVVLMAGAIYLPFGVWSLAVPLFFLISTLSPLAANGVSGALEPFKTGAGAASSVFGVMQFGAGGLAGYLTSLIYDGTPLPMAGLILVGALASFTALRVLVPKET